MVRIFLIKTNNFKFDLTPLRRIFFQRIKVIHLNTSFHTYVCLAILQNFKEDLQDLDQSELHSFLNSVPLFDVDVLISDALRIQEELIERGLVVEVEL
jgi:hypothetical protein